MAKAKKRETFKILVRKQVDENHPVARANLQAIQQPLEHCLMAGHTFPYVAPRNTAVEITIVTKKSVKHQTQQKKQQCPNNCCFPVAVQPSLKHPVVDIHHNQEVDWYESKDMPPTFLLSQQQIPWKHMLHHSWNGRLLLPAVPSCVHLLQ